MLNIGDIVKISDCDYTITFMIVSDECNQYKDRYVYTVSDSLGKMYKFIAEKTNFELKTKMEAISITEIHNGLLMTLTDQRLCTLTHVTNSLKI